MASKISLDPRSYYLPGGESGVLLLHGLTGTPQCMRYPGAKLQEAGFTVSAPMLEGHGTHYSHLEKTTWEDWYQSAERAFHELRVSCRTVMVAGLSTGGLIAAHLAYSHPRQVTALGLLATPLFLDGFLIRKIFPAVWNSPLRRLYRYQPKYLPSIGDPEARRQYQSYDKMPVASVAVLLDFQQIVRKELKSIHQPTIILHSLHDQTVSYGNMDYIKAVLPNRENKTVELKRSDHIITVDFEKDLVARQLVKFFKKYR